MKVGRFNLYEEKNGGITVSYIDTGVEMFEGGSYEAQYGIDKENREKLEAILRRTNSGTLIEMMKSEFGDCLQKKSFAAWCDEQGIKYDLFTWIDDD